MGRRASTASRPLLSCVLLRRGGRGGAAARAVAAKGPVLSQIKWAARAGRCYATGPGEAPMLKRAFLALAAVLTVTFALAGPASAGFRVCNHSSQRVDLAFGYPHDQFGWTSEGWWTLARRANAGTIMRGTLSNRFYYLYATGSHGSIWQAPERPGRRLLLHPARALRLAEPQSREGRRARLRRAATCRPSSSSRSTPGAPRPHPQSER